MPGDYVATSSVTVEAPPARVWDIVTDPAGTREFMFGTELSKVKKFSERG